MSNPENDQQKQSGAAPVPPVGQTQQPEGQQASYSNQGYGAQYPYPSVSGQQPYGAAQGQPHGAPQQPYGAAQGQPYGAAPQQPYTPDVYVCASTAAPAAASAQPKRRGWIVALVLVVGLLLLCGFGIWSCSSAMGSIAGTSDSAASLNHDAVAVIDIDSTIQYDNTACSPEGLKYLLDEAAENDHITAVVLRVNSGGGTATAGEEMATYVKQFREDTGKPVVVSSASLNASAAYNISSQADYIFTAKTTEIGAIGTVIQNISYGELLDKLGISVDNITSADSKDSSYGTRELTEEERAYYQDLVNKTNECFIANVAEGRNMSEEDVRALATGLVFMGTDAVENGLADEVGTLEDAVEKAAQLAGSKSTDTIYLDIDSSSSDLSALLDLMGESSSSVDDVVSGLKEGSDERVAQ